MKKNSAVNLLTSMSMETDERVSSSGNNEEHEVGDVHIGEPHWLARLKPDADYYGCIESFAAVRCHQKKALLIPDGNVRAATRDLLTVEGGYRLFSFPFDWEVVDFLKGMGAIYCSEKRAWWVPINRTADARDVVTRCIGSDGRSWNVVNVRLEIETTIAVESESASRGISFSGQHLLGRHNGEIKLGRNVELIEGRAYDRQVSRSWVVGLRPMKGRIVIDITDVSRDRFNGMVAISQKPEFPVEFSNAARISVTEMKD